MASRPCAEMKMVTSKTREIMFQQYIKNRLDRHSRPPLKIKKILNFSVRMYIMKKSPKILTNYDPKLKSSYIS